MDKLQVNSNSNLAQTKQSRPLLAIINEDFPKFREITIASEYDDLINYLTSLLNIKVSSETDQKDLQIQMLVILDFIKSKFGFLTIPEIKEAFKMYVAKDFGHKDVFRTLDAIVVSDVLNCFLNYRSEKLRIYVQKNQKLALEEENKLSNSEIEKIMIDAVNNKFSEFIKTQDISEPLEHIFKELIQRKIIKMPSEEFPKLFSYYDKKLEEAKKQITSELKGQKVLSKKEKVDIDKHLKDISENNSSKVEIRAKKLVLIDFFKKQIELGNNKII